jgi:Ulp1 family protease
MLSVTDELLTYINVRSYHYILLIIEVDSGIVEIYDSLAKPEEKYKSIIDALKR